MIKHTTANFGDKIERVEELVKLAEDKKAVAFVLGANYICVRPAAFMIHWPLVQLSKLKFYHFKKES